MSLQKVKVTKSAGNNYTLAVPIAKQSSLTKKYYENILVYDLILKQNFATVMQLPRLKRIILNTTSKKYINDKKFILLTLTALELIAGQKPKFTYAKKSIANFKVRQYQLIGCQVLLNNTKMYSFLDKLSKIIFPRIRDTLFFSKKIKNKRVSTSNFYKKKKDLITQNLGFRNLMIFPELENNFELVDNFNGMNLTFLFSNSNRKYSILLLSGLQLPLIS